MLTDTSSIDATSVGGMFSVVPFDPNDLVNQDASNMQTQLQTMGSVREELASMRASIAQDVANTDLAAMQEYATDAEDHQQDMFVTGYTAPALISIAPDNVTNPLSSDLMDSSTGELTIASTTDGLMGESTGSTEALLTTTSENTTAVGCSLYVSSVVSDDLSSDTAYIASTTSDTILGVVQGECSALKTDDCSDLTAAIADSLNGTSAGDGAATDLMGETTMSSLFFDTTGGTFEAVITNVIEEVGQSVVDTTKTNQFDQNTILSAAASVSNSVFGDVLGTVGGINLTNTNVLAAGMTVTAVAAAVESGNPYVAASLIGSFTDTYGFSSSIFNEDLITLGKRCTNNPYNAAYYTDALNAVGLNITDQLIIEVATGDSAHRRYTDSSLTSEVRSYIDGLLGNTIDAHTFTDLTQLGDQIMFRTMDRDTYRKCSALTNMGSIDNGIATLTNMYSSGASSGKHVGKAAQHTYTSTTGTVTYGRIVNYSADVTKMVRRASALK